MKTELEAIASQYAEAVLELAFQDKNNAELAEQINIDLALVNHSIESTPEFKLILEHPSIASQEKKQVIKLVFTGKVQDLTLRLLELLTDKRRLKLLPVLEEQYKEKLKARKEIVTAILLSATALDEGSIANIKASLTEHLGKCLDLEVAQDNSLIGGFILRLGDQVIDGSLKGKLRNLEKVLLAV
jgi:F-type H+-transporting ATPase subunit delta